jgi:primosomal protein N'
MYLITVLPLSKKARTDVLSYFYSADIPLGMLVEVPFRGKPMLALVTSTKPVEDAKGEIKEAGFQLKKMTKVIGDEPVQKELFTSIRELADFYLAPFSKVIDEVVPDFVIEQIAQTNLPPLARNTPVPTLFIASADDRLGWYKTRIRELFAQKKSMYIVAPTEREARTLHTQLSRGIEEYTILITGTLPKKKLQQAAEKIKTTEHPVCIFGTATYVTVPRADLDTVVIEHESSQNYKRITYPHIDMRHFIELYAKARKLSLIFADTLPRVETYHRFTAGELTEVQTITFHPELPARETIIPRENRAERRSFRMISEKMEEEIVRAGEAGAQTFIFALRNGLASVTSCRDCSEVVTCEFCGAALALYTTGDKRVFVCNACKQHAPTDSPCRRCGSWNLQPYGVGVESVHEECQTRFPDRPLFRLDRMSVSSDAEAEEIVAAFDASPGAILIGTELALHYLTKQIPVVAVASLDSLFYIPSFRVSERIVELITLLREKAGKVFAIQTMYPDDKLLTITSKPKLTAWYAAELEERKVFNYPPFSTIIKVVTLVPKSRLVPTRELLTKELAAWSPDIFTGNSPEKNATKLVALIRVPKNQWWPGANKKEELSNLRQVLASLQDSCTVLINPEDLL